VAEHADLVVADEDDAALSVLEVRKLGDEFFRHLIVPAILSCLARTEARRIIPSS
jgi:hypothetical protein